MNRSFCRGEQQPGQVDFPRLARALAAQPMLGGHTARFWSAAQHRVALADSCGCADWRIHALLHDASDAVLGVRDGPVQLAEEQTFARLATAMDLSSVTGVRLYRDARRQMTAAADRAIHLAAGCQYPPPADALRHITDLDVTLRARAEQREASAAAAASCNHLTPEGAADLWLACLHQELHRRGWPTAAEKAADIAFGRLIRESIISTDAP